MPLYFPEGRGSLRLEVLATKHTALTNFTLTLYIYKLGALIEQFSSYSVFRVLERLTHWKRIRGTKPEPKVNDT